MSDKPPEILDKIADIVLKYKPKDKQPKPTKKTQKRKKEQSRNV